MMPGGSIGWGGKVMNTAERFLKGLPEATPEEESENQEEARRLAHNFTLHRTAPWKRQVQA